MRLNALAFVLGTWLLQSQAALPDRVWGYGVALPWLLAGWLRLRSQAIAARVLFACGFIAAGFCWAAWLAQLRLAEALPQAWEGRDMQVVGVVAALPQAHQRGLRFEFDIEQLLTPRAQAPRHVSLNWYADPRHQAGLPAVHAGERWRLTLRLKRPHGNANPHGFDYEAWLLERNIRATGYVRAESANVRLAERVERPRYWIERWRERIRERFASALPGAPYAGVLVALAIGDQQAISSAQWQVFTRTGVNHLMSISGLHVTLFASLTVGAVYWLWRRSATLTLRLPARKAAAAAGLLAAWLYALLAGYAVPAQRTVYMLGVVALALWLGRVSAASTVLCAALLLVTWLDPWAVLAPGFWLSFGAVALILYVSAGRLGQPHWLVAWGRVQWAVTLGLIPLLLALFQQISLVSPLANAAAIPLVSFAVVPLTLFGAVLPLDFLLHLAHLAMAAVMWLLEALSALPAAVWQQHAPPAWTVAAALAGIAWLLLPRGFPARGLGVVGLLPLFFTPPPLPAAGEVWLTVLDVGQGLAVVAQTKNHALLYDTGPDYSGEADSGNRIIVPFLRGAGIRHLDGVLVTHDDQDHSGGAISVLQALPVGWFASSLPARHPVLQQVPSPLRCYAGQAWQWDGVRFEVLHPTWQSYADAKLKDNARGCVLRIAGAYGTVLLSADIERDAERELLACCADKLPAQLLVVPHHGSKTSSSQAFLDAVQPQLAVITVGYRNRFGHPKPEVVARYRALGSRILRSDRDGALSVNLGAGGMKVTTWRGARPRYWQAPADLDDYSADR